MSETLKKYILITAGSISLLLGLLGIFVPVLPTTPFLLLTAFCYLRSSEKLYNWLINHKTFGSYIYNYITHKAITPKTKKTAIVSLFISISISIYIVNNLYIGILLTIIGFAVAYHILSLNSLKS